MSAAGTPPRALAWAPLLAVAVLSSGLAAGVWKQMGLDMPRFCVLFVIGKIAVGAGSWLSRAPWRPGPPRAPASRAFLAFAALAAALNGLAWVAYLIAFERGPLPIVQTLSASYTAVAAVLAVIFLRERLAFVQVAGVVLVVVAGMLLAYVAEAPAPGSRGGWLVACLAAVALWGASAAVAKHAYSLAGADHPRFFLVHGLGLAATLLPYGLWLAPGAAGATGSAGAADLALPTLLVVLLYLAADLGIYTATARGPASIVNPIFGLYPIPSIAYAALVLGDRPGRLAWSAIAMASVGMLLVLPAAENPIRRLLVRCRPRG